MIAYLGLAAMTIPRILYQVRREKMLLVAVVHLLAWPLVESADAASSKMHISSYQNLQKHACSADGTNTLVLNLSSCRNIQLPSLMQHMVCLPTGAAATSHQGSLIQAQLDTQPIWTQASIAQQMPADAQTDLDTEMPNQCYQFKEGMRHSIVASTQPCCMQNFAALLPLL